VAVTQFAAAASNQNRLIRWRPDTRSGSSLTGFSVCFYEYVAVRPTANLLANVCLNYLERKVKL